MEKYEKTRGWRNNNPLNIVRSSDYCWVGSAEQQTDSRFVVFTNMSYGYRAAIKTLQSYVKALRLQGLTYNLQNIIYRWCPSKGYLQYAENVAKWSGISSTTKELPEPQKALPLFAKIMAAMTRQECGVPPEHLPWVYIKGGIYLAYKVKITDDSLGIK